MEMNVSKKTIDVMAKLVDLWVRLNSSPAKKYLAEHAASEHNGVFVKFNVDDFENCNLKGEYDYREIIDLCYDDAMMVDDINVVSERCFYIRVGTVSSYTRGKIYFKSLVDAIIDNLYRLDKIELAKTFEDALNLAGNL